MVRPFLEAALPEFPLLVPDQHDPFDQGSCRDDVAVVDLEPHQLQVMLNIARENELNALELLWKQVQFIAPLHVPRDLLSKVRNIADGLFAITHTRHRVATSV